MSSPRREIITDDAVRKVLKDVLDMPDRIKAAQDLIDDAQYELATFSEGIEAQAKLDEIRNETLFVVKKEKDPETGKPMYSNEEARSAQVQILCNKDKEYVDALRIVANAARNKAALQMHVGKLVNGAKHVTNQMYACKSVCEVIAGLAVEDVDTAAWQKLSTLKAELETIINR